MRQQPALWPSSRWHLARFRPDLPALYFAPHVLEATAKRFLEEFPGMVTYAVKANDHAVVLENLVNAGISAFDVASLPEMARVRASKPDAILHYHNPVRSRDEIAAADGYGIQSWSIDCPCELEKLAEVKRSEVSVRLKLPVKGAAYDFGEKFGADPQEAVALLRRAAEMGFATSITFHPGTQCADPEAWAVYIYESAKVAKRAGVQLRRLNVGGGFAAHRTGAAPDITAIFDRIGAATREAFDVMPELVCEPGRAMVSEAFSLGVRVKSMRQGAVYLNDGIYGALAELRDMAPTDRVSVISDEGKARSAALTPLVVYGPTCDSVDRLPDPLPLPDDLEEGDYLIFDGLGAYSLAISTRFNGYGDQNMVTVSNL